MVKSPRFATCKLVEFAQQHCECVRVFFFLNPKSQQVHPLSFFWCHLIAAKKAYILLRLWAYYFAFSAVVNGLAPGPLTGFFLFL
jgi:hypothetical protein